MKLEVANEEPGMLSAVNICIDMWRVDSSLMCKKHGHGNWSGETGLAHIKETVGITKQGLPKWLVPYGE